MLIADAQIHIWSKGNPPALHRQAPYLANQAIAEMNAAGVDRALIHPPLWDTDSNALAIDAVQLHPDRFSILGQFPLDRPESRTLLDGWKERPGMLGLRFVFHLPHETNWPSDGTLDWLWAAAERANVPVALAAARFLPTVGQIAERHPGLRLIVDHMGAPRATQGDEAYQFLPGLIALAKYPNVAIKATGQPGYALDAYPFRSIHGYLRQVFDAFGPHRMFWGSDITRMPCTWKQCVTLFTEQLPWLHGQDLELVMGRALCAWVGWELPVD